MVNARSLLALILEVGFVAVALFGRMVLHRHRTGDWGFRWQRHDRAARLSGVLFVAAILLGIGGAVLAATAATPLLAALDRDVVAVVGVAVYTAGFLLTFVSQSAMGASWRVGVDPGESTDLVVDGPFGFARNPVFTGMITVAVGLALIAPTVPMIAAVLLLVAAIELQVRAVEEPHLRTAAPSWTNYAGDVGRFVPRIGRIRR